MNKKEMIFALNRSKSYFLMFFFLFFIFIFLSSSFVQAELFQASVPIPVLTTKQTKDFSSVLTDTYHSISWDNDGLNVYISDTANNGTIFQYSTPEPYNLDGLTYVQNLTNISNLINKSVCTNINYNFFSFSLVNNFLYIGYGRIGGNDIYIQRAVLTGGNISSANMSFCPTRFTEMTSQTNNPSALSVTQDGNFMLLGYTTSTGINRTSILNTSIPYVFGTIDNSNWFNFTHSDNSYNSQRVTGIVQFFDGNNSYIYQAQTNNINSFQVVNNSLSGINSVALNKVNYTSMGFLSVSGNSDVTSGLFIAQEYSNTHLFTFVSSTLIKADINLIGLGVFIPEQTNVTTGLVNNANLILGFFPDASTLTLRQKYSIGILTMLGFFALFLLLAMKISEKAHVLVMIICGLVEVALYLFFTAIQYFSVGILVVILLVALAIILLRIKSGGGG